MVSLLTRRVSSARRAACTRLSSCSRCHAASRSANNLASSSAMSRASSAAIAANAASSSTRFRTAMSSLHLRASRRTVASETNRPGGTSRGVARSARRALRLPPRYLSAGSHQRRGRAAQQIERWRLLGAALAAAEAALACLHSDGARGYPAAGCVQGRRAGARRQLRGCLHGHW